MTLPDWLASQDMTHQQLAERLGVTRQAVSMWCSGEVAPTLGRLQQLQLLTDGQVLPLDFPAPAAPPRPNRLKVHRS